MSDSDLLKARARPAEWTPERAALAVFLSRTKHWPDQAIADKLNELFDMDVRSCEVRTKLNQIEEAEKQKRGSR